MKRGSLFSMGLVFLFALIGLGLWWFLRPTATAPAKAAVSTPTLAKIDSVKIATQPAQVELPKAPAVPAHTEAATSAPGAAPSSDDPQADLKTVIADLARLAETGNTAEAYESYIQPGKLDMQLLQYRQKETQSLQAIVDGASNSQDSHALQAQQQILAMREAAAFSYRAMENQTPTYNIAGDEATYMRPVPDVGAGLASDSVPMTFIRIDGKWYIKSSH